jgi:DNA-binding response OmpR family regulator
VSSPVAHETLTVLVFSHRPEVREAIIMAVGRRPASDLPRVRFHEASGIAEVLQGADAGEFDLLILDGEAQPTGGMGVSRQLKNEIDDCPPIIVTVRRRDDRWLATWSQADAVLVHPLDPLTAAETVADVLRRSSAVPARSAGGAPIGTGHG